MKDEIASFKVTAADIQNNQSTLPGTDTRKKCGHFIYIYIYTVGTSSRVGVYVQYIVL